MDFKSVQRATCYGRGESEGFGQVRITLHKYISNEIWPTFLTSLAVFVFITVATRMLTVSEWVITRGVHPGHVGRLIFYLLPGIILFALPAACLMAVFIAFLRLSSDNEILALKSSGISLFQMLPSVLIVSAMSCLIAMFLGVFGAPWGNRSFKNVIFQIAQSKADLGVKERIFCEPFDDVTFYINSFSTADRAMRDVFVVDRRDPTTTNTIVAKEGRILSYPQARTISIRFSRGTIFMVDKDFQSTRTMKFDAYNLNIGLNDIMRALSSRKKAPKEMSVPEILDTLKEETKGSIKYNETLIELLEKISIPLAVFLMGMIGVPLGAQLRARGRSSGIVMGLLIFLVYYMCLAGVRSLCETGTLSPLVGVWIPDLFLTVSCLYLWHRAVKERPISLPQRIRFKWIYRQAER
jgi:lipopolysaccharide export system permease protein